MKVEVRESGGDLLLVFEGQGLVQDAEALAALLKGALERKARTATLDLSGVQAADVSFFQLVIAFGVSLASKGLFPRLLALSPDHELLRTGELLGIRLEDHFRPPEERR